jgi:LasA protease
VSIVCTARGEQVSAGGSSSDLWDRISSGGFVPDVQVDTGSNDPVMPACSG